MNPLFLFVLFEIAVVTLLGERYATIHINSYLWFTNDPNILSGVGESKSVGLAPPGKKAFIHCITQIFRFRKHFLTSFRLSQSRGL